MTLPLPLRSTKELLGHAAELTAMAEKASLPEIRRFVLELAERFRDLAVRRAAVDSLPPEDPARTALENSVERLAGGIVGSSRAVDRGE
jgi:hypothetical protein